MMGILLEMVELFEKKGKEKLIEELKLLDFKDVAYVQVMTEKMSQVVKDFEMNNW